MTSEIDKLKHFHVENYSGTNFTDDLNDDEEFLYTTIRCKDNKEVSVILKSKIINLFRTTKNTEAVVFENGGFVGNLGLSKKLWKKYIEVSYKYRTNTGKITASDYTHLFGYLNPYYRSAYNVSKRRK